MLAKTKTIKVGVAFKRSSEYQTVDYTLEEEIELEDGDDRQAVIDASRQDLARQVNDFCETAIKRLVAAAK